MKILFPTDFSETAEHAFVYALKMAKATGASIVTIHVYSLPDIRGVSLPNTLKEIYEGISLEEFENYRDSIPALRAIADREGASDVDISHVLQEGEPVHSILNAATVNHADLVIMGTTGAGMIKEMFLGSVAAEVMENANVPVMAVPKGASFDGDIDHIAVTTELLEEDERALTKVLSFARIFGAKVFCVNADASHSSKYTERVHTFRDKFPQVQFHVLDSVDIEGAVSAFV